MSRITPVDDNLALGGAVANYLGVPLVIARANNPKFKKIFRTLSRPHQRDIDRGTIKEEVAESIFCKALAQGILLGWEQDKFPGKLPYSPENAEDLLLNDEDCRSFVVEFSKTAENYFTEDKEEVLGNSSKPSAGVSNTEKTLSSTKS